MSKTRTILSTSAFWLLLFSFGTLYMLFQGMEIRLPAGNIQDSQIESVFDVADNAPILRPSKKHR
jgi:hypothetical protein